MSQPLRVKPDVDEPEPPRSGLWRDVRQAIHGSHTHDYTKGSIPRAILLLAIPMVLEMLMESVFAVVDVFWVARLGASAVATVGLTESMLTMIYAMAIGLSIGVTAMVARRIGEKDPDGAARVAVQAIVLGAVLSAVLGVVGVNFAPELLALMGAEPEVIANVTFTRVMLGGNATIVLLFLINAIFRGAGDAAIAMRVLWFANLLNIVLGPCFIFGLGPFPELGVTGAAVATNIGRGAGAVYALSRLVGGRGRIGILSQHVRVELSLMWRLIRLSASGAFQVFIGMASWVGLIRVLADFGSDALAGYTIGIRVVIFALLPSWGLSNAAATMVGQALGAKDPERAEKAVWKAGLYNLYFLGTVGALFVVFAPQIGGIFTSDPEVLRYAVDCLRIIALGFLFYAYGMVVTQSFNGAGDTWTPTWINLVIFWMFEIPLAYVLAIHLRMGPHGVFIAITVAYTMLAIVSAAIFRRGAWKTKHV